MNNNKVILFTLLVCLYLLPAKLFASNNYLFVGTTFPLILEAGEDKSPKGVSVDILNRISDITGDKFDIKIVPWPRAMALIKSGRASGFIGPYKNKERQAFIDYSTVHFYEDRMVFLKKTNFDFNWQGDFSRVLNKNILAVKQWAYGETFERNRPLMNIIETVDSRNALKMLAKGRVDLLAFNERNAKVEIQKNQLQGLIDICLPPYSEARGYFGFSKKRGEHALQKRFNKALNILLETGEIQQINAKYQLIFENN